MIKSYSDAEAWLLSLSNLPRHSYSAPSKRHLNRERIRRFLRLLDHPEKYIPHYIHITGTSGKGSVAVFLASILTAAGHHTGLMTSPHHTTLRERWQINGTMMSKPEFFEIIKKIQPVLEQYHKKFPEDNLSFFDLVTAIGFYYFAQKQIGWAVVEVGVGGRDDVTNVMPKKDVAVITTIGRDHQDLLGETLTEVTTHKTGIITRGARVFTMVTDPTLLSIIQKEVTRVRAREVTMSPLGSLHINSITADGTNFTYDSERYQITAPGVHQARNAALAIDIAKALRIPERSIKNGLKKAKQSLRMEIISHTPLIIVDGAHNPDKMITTIETTLTLKQSEKKNNIHLLLGFAQNDETLPKMIRQLTKLQPASVTCTRNTVHGLWPVAAPATIAKYWRRYLPSKKIVSFVDPMDALAHAQKQATSKDILLITGSIFLSGEIKKLF